MSGAPNPLLEPFMSTAEAAAKARPEVDADMIREIFLEVATVLHNGLALDGLDQHDYDAVVAGLCEELVDPDPGTAVRARAERTRENPGDLHDPDAVWAAYLTSADLLRL